LSVWHMVYSSRSFAADAHVERAEAYGCVKYGAPPACRFCPPSSSAPPLPLLPALPSSVLCLSITLLLNIASLCIALKMLRTMLRVYVRAAALHLR
jgi:hypothetical protein